MVRKILNIGSDIKIMLGQVRSKSYNPVIKDSMEFLGNDLSKELIKIV